MSKSKHISETPATLWLKRHALSFEEFPYAYVEHGGTAESARQLGVDEHRVIKTLVMQDESARPMIVLMHGDRTVSTKNLARLIGVKRIEACRPDVANRHSGYLVGGTSPFGLRRSMPIYVEAGVLQLDHIYLNGGRRGFLIRIDPKLLIETLAAVPVECALEAH
jgi:Cys-tRNA(Pro) deacylase